MTSLAKRKAEAVGLDLSSNEFSKKTKSLSRSPGPVDSQLSANEALLEGNVDGLNDNSVSISDAIARGFSVPPKFCFPRQPSAPRFDPDWCALGGKPDYRPFSNILFASFPALSMTNIDSDFGNINKKALFEEDIVNTFLRKPSRSGRARSSRKRGLSNTEHPRFPEDQSGNDSKKKRFKMSDLDDLGKALEDEQKKSREFEKYSRQKLMT